MLVNLFTVPCWGLNLRLSAHYDSPVHIDLKTNVVVCKFSVLWDENCDYSSYSKASKMTIFGSKMAICCLPLVNPRRPLSHVIDLSLEIRSNINWGQSCGSGFFFDFLIFFNVVRIRIRGLLKYLPVYLLYLNLLVLRHFPAGYTYF